MISNCLVRWVHAVIAKILYYNFSLTNAYTNVNDSFQEEAGVYKWSAQSDGMVNIKTTFVAVL